MVMVLVLLPTSVYADGSGGKEVKEEEKQDSNVIKKEKKDIEIRYPNKLEPKTPPKNSNIQNNNTNTGKRTEPSEARATVIENVNNANKTYPIYHGVSKAFNSKSKESGGVEKTEGNSTQEVKNLSDNSKIDNEDKYAADARQFITFQTKNGKIFHLIINHDEKTENVMLLTEVSEDDLLNMVDQKEKPQEIVKEKPIKDEVKPEKKEEKSSLGTYLILILVAAGALGAGYYFKVVKKKEDKELENFEEEDDDFFSEAEEKEDTNNKLDDDEDLL